MTVISLARSGNSTPLDVCLPLNVGGVSVYSKEGQVWLKSGVTSRDTSLYPDAYALFEPALAIGTYASRLNINATSGAVNKATGDYWVLTSDFFIRSYNVNDLQYINGIFPIDLSAIGFSSGGGLVTNGAKLYLINSGGTKVGVFDLDGTYNVGSDITVSGGVNITNISDATWDGEFFWTSSADNQYIQKFDASWSHIADPSGFFLPPGIIRPSGIVWDGVNYWVGEGNTQRARVGDGANISATVSQIRQYNSSWLNTGQVTYDTSADLDTRGMFMSTVGSFYQGTSTGTTLKQYGIGGSGAATIGMPVASIDSTTGFPNYVRVS